MTSEIMTAVLVGVVIGWCLKLAWDWAVDWWFDASGGWLRDVFAIIGVIAVCWCGWIIFT